ncbi:MAG: hypothetical protein G01um101429_987, partial [Parcubacteria group bacterium Gr01-1014_29]
MGIIIKSCPYANSKTNTEILP